MPLSASLLIFSAFLAASDFSVEREVYSMGTILKLTSLEPEREKAILEMDALFQVIEQTEKELSTWLPSSELSRLNQQPHGVPFTASASLFELLQTAGFWVKETGGSFEPTVGHPVSGFMYLEMNEENRTITKTKPVFIDSGAFGKGEALDRARKLAEAKMYAPLVLDFGGQIATAGLPPDQKLWNIAIAIPESRDRESSVTVALKNGSFSTSGQSERSGHILDPRNGGQPAPDFGSVTVWHRRALLADILSTALFVMGPEEGFQWAVNHEVAACFLIHTSSGIQVRKTPAFERL